MKEKEIGVKRKKERINEIKGGERERNKTV